MIDFLTTLFGDSKSFALLVSTPSQGRDIRESPFTQIPSPTALRFLAFRRVLRDWFESFTTLMILLRSALRSRSSRYSHLSLHADGNPYKRYLSHPEEVMVTCKAGSAAIINQAIFHGNYPNRSHEDRHLLAIAIGRSWAGPTSEVPDWDPEMWAKLPSHVRRFFQSLNMRKIDYSVGNRPPDMATEAPGINPSRWDV